MRILCANPDTLGDLVLRQPMYTALTGAGHELMLLVRAEFAPMAGLVAPGAEVLAYPADVYSAQTDPADEDFSDLMAAIDGFAPEALLIAPYQWTAFEQHLSVLLEQVRVVAMNGRVWSGGVLTPGGLSTRITHLAEVQESDVETSKYERLTAAMLGQNVTLADPVLRLRERDLASTDEALGALGLEPGGYWAAGVGHTRGTAVRNWQADRWGALLSHWSRTHGRRFLLIGSEQERATSEAVAGSLDDGACRMWFGSGPEDLTTLAALIGRGAGYVGRDSGPMHIAGALGRPVLAIFGGGTWPRFLPAVSPSVSLTVQVPCAGCQWHCHLPAPVCIRDVPVDKAIRAADDLEAGRVTGRTRVIIRPGRAVLESIGREGATVSLDRLRRSVSLAHQLRRARQDLAAAREQTRQNQHSAQESASLKAQIQQHEKRDRERERELGRVREQLESLTARLRETETRLADRGAAAAGAQARNAELTRNLEQATGRAQRAERTVEEQREKLHQSREEAEHLRRERNDARTAADRLRPLAEACEKAEAEAEQAQRRCAELETELNRIAAASARQTAELSAKLDEHERLEAERRARVEDLRLALSRAEQDNVRMVKLSRQQQEQVRQLQRRSEALAQLRKRNQELTRRTQRQQAQADELRTRLDNLLASRWRRLGQRLGLAMTLPWEAEARNGSRPRKPAT